MQAVQPGISCVAVADTVNRRVTATAGEQEESATRTLSDVTRNPVNSCGSCRQRPVRPLLLEVPRLRVAADVGKLVKFLRPPIFNVDLSVILATTRFIRAVHMALRIREALSTSAIQIPCETALPNRVMAGTCSAVATGLRPWRIRRISGRWRTCARSGRRRPSRPAGCCALRPARCGFRPGSPLPADASPPRPGWPTAQPRRCRRA